MPSRGAPLAVEVDLELDIDGTPATLRSEHDGVLRLQTSHPHQVWAASGLPTGGVATLANGLAEAGLKLEVSGSSGVVATLGADVDSRLGRLALGSSRVMPGTPLAAGRAVAAGTDGRVIAAICAAAVIVVWVAVSVRGRQAGT